jgi:hypothetical protein
MSVELFTISSRGFEPTHITRPAGRVLLVIVTEGELPTLNLRLQRADGAVVGQVNMPSKRKRGSIPATLVPGRYRLVDPNRPRIVCDIEITP